MENKEKVTSDKSKKEEYEEMVKMLKIDRMLDIMFAEYNKKKNKTNIVKRLER